MFTSSTLFRRSACPLLSEAPPFPCTALEVFAPAMAPDQVVVPAPEL